MKTASTLLLMLLVAVSVLSADTAAKPKLKVAADGFPTGHDTPEGAACDLARAFIERDAFLFTRTCVRLYVGTTGPEEYAEFLKDTTEGIKAEAARKDAPARGPKAIVKVFASRRLSKNGPASFGYASFGFHDVRFVDVGVLLHGDKEAMNRTMVIQDRDDKWYVHPLPAVSPNLSTGLNEESPSKQDFSAVYEIQK